MSAPRWQRTWRADPRAAALADRHYSRKSPGAAQFSPPGRCFPLITAAGDAVWVTSWPLPEYTLHGFGDAWVCTLFRNESEHLSSALIVEALAATRAAWGDPPGGGTLTFVDAGAVRRKRDPGRCFIRAGFTRLDRLTKDRGLVILRLAAAEHPLPREAPGTQQTMEMGGDVTSTRTSPAGGAVALRAAHEAQPRAGSTGRLSDVAPARVRFVDKLAIDQVWIRRRDQARYRVANTYARDRQVLLVPADGPRHGERGTRLLIRFADLRRYWRRDEMSA